MKAYAKINLLLRICGRLSNGYHRLITLMHTIDLCDEVEIEYDSGKAFGISIDCGHALDIDEKSNLCYLAADAFFSRMNKKNEIMPFVHIRVKKNIPSQAGLGGGSSDAACVLRLLQEHFGKPFSKRQLHSIASTLGADVPFFLYGGCAVCEGTGEIITRVQSLDGLQLIIVKPSEGVMTPQCFKLADEYGFDEGKIDDEYFSFADILDYSQLEPLDKVLDIKNLLINDLERPARELMPKIGEVIDIIDEQGSLHTAMSGSGSACFGLFTSEEDAKRAFDSLSGDQRLSDCRIYHSVTC